MKKIIFAITISAFCSCKNQAQESKSLNSQSTAIMDQNFNNSPDKITRQSIYDFKVKTLSGDEFDFATLKGKKVMIVNTASKCGNTPQYKDLETIYKKYESKNFVIIGFPANDFGQQEPGSNETISEFCTLNYGVTFPMMSKISVKGKEMVPVYQFLTQKVRNGVKDSQVEWNFQKYLINEKGELEKVISPKTLPTDKEIIDWINK